MQFFIDFPYLAKTSVFCNFVSYDSVKTGNFVTFFAKINFFLKEL
jgi:hypothetical protein